MKLTLLKSIEENEAKLEKKEAEKLGYNAEIVNIPIVIKRDNDGNIVGFTTLDNLIIPLEYEEEWYVEFKRSKICLTSFILFL